MVKQERESSDDASRPGVTAFDVLLRKALREFQFPGFCSFFPHSSHPVSLIQGVTVIVRLTCSEKKEFLSLLLTQGLSAPSRS